MFNYWNYRFLKFSETLLFRNHFCLSCFQILITLMFTPSFFFQGKKMSLENWNKKFLPFPFLKFSRFPLNRHAGTHKLIYLRNTSTKCLTNDSSLPGREGWLGAATSVWSNPEGSQLTNPSILTSTSSAKGKGKVQEAKSLISALPSSKHLGSWGWR